MTVDYQAQALLHSCSQELLHQMYATSLVHVLLADT